VKFRFNKCWWKNQEFQATSFQWTAVSPKHPKNNEAGGAGFKAKGAALLHPHLKNLRISSTNGTNSWICRARPVFSPFFDYRLNAIAAEGIDLWGGVRHLLCVLHPARFCCHFTGVTSHHPMVAIAKMTQKTTKFTYGWANYGKLSCFCCHSHWPLPSCRQMRCLSGCRDGWGGRNGCATIRFWQCLPTSWVTILTNNVNHRHES
jgi:hypothetical protein